ncbi:transposase family protein [Micromonospora sp. NPDC000207]|uniref:transposase family protein n=1 Tax=Micromonospora sp. NPDC000207 TaxID=3154246 RepID=UPI00332BF696
MSPVPCTGLLPSYICRPWPTPATKALADSGHEGAGQGIHTPYKQPADGHRLAPDNQTYNAVLRSVRCLGERGFAILTGRWRTLRHTTASPRGIGDIVRAAVHLTHLEYRYPPDSC